MRRRRLLSILLCVVIVSMMIAPSSTLALPASEGASNIAFRRPAYGSLYQNVPGMGDTLAGVGWAVTGNGTTTLTNTSLPSFDETAQNLTDGIIPQSASEILGYPEITATNINGTTTAGPGVSALSVPAVGALPLIDGQGNVGSSITFVQGTGETATPISETNPLLINVKLPKPAKVMKYSLLQPLGNTAINNRPNTWRLQASEDGVTYVDIDTFAATKSGSLTRINNGTPFNGMDVQYYDAEGYDGFYAYNGGATATMGVQRDTACTKEYTYYRLVITKMINPATTGNLTLALSDFALYEETPNGTYKNVLKNPFISRWTSSADEEQWVYVDLGEDVSYDSATLYWGSDSYPTSYKLQVANDEYNWTDVASVSKTSGGADIVTFPVQTARYIRMYADARVAGSNEYSLYEFEVSGTRNAPAYQNPERPAPAADGTQELTGGDWTIARADDIAENGEQLSMASFDDSAWVPAKVPGTALTSYLAAGIIPEPDFDMNQMQISDTFFYSDFWYRTSFDIPADKAGRNVFLNFDAVSWKAKVFVNGQYVDIIEGSYIRGRLDISQYVNYGGKNYLAVLAVQPMHYGSPRVKSYQNPLTNGGILGADNPSIHASIGWDWIPVIRGRNTGLYDKVYIDYTGGVELIDPWVVTDFDEKPDPGPEEIKYDLTKAITTFKTEVKNTRDTAVTATVSGTYSPGNISFSRTVSVPPGETVQLDIEDIIINNPDIWWPNTYGDQPLYTVEAKVTVDGAVTDSKTFRFGARKLDYTYTGNFTGAPGASAEGTSCVNVICNGVRIYLRGGNWGMDDSNVDLSYEDYRVRVRLHAEENFTMIRNWVGMVGKEAFWDACDEYGILIYDDFWLANPWDGPEPLDNAMFMENAIDKVKKVRKHPSEAIYCARNESTSVRPLDWEMQKATEDYDGTRVYVRASNNNVWGINGNGPYAEQDRKQYYYSAGGTYQLHTERGQHVIANPEVYKYYFRQENIWPGLTSASTTAHPWRGSAVAANTWAVHDFFFGGNGPAGNFMRELNYYMPLSPVSGTASAYMSDPENNNIETFSKMSQMPNYDLHRAMFEAFVEQKGDSKSGGLLMWMSLSCWPSFAWRTFDYFYDTSSAFFGIKKASEPLSVIWNPTITATGSTSNTKTYNPNPGLISLSNNTAKVQTNLRVAAKIYSMNSELLWSEEYEIDKLLIGEVYRVDTVSPSLWSELGSTRIKFLKLELYDENNDLIFDNFYWKDSNETANSTAPNYTDMLTLDKVDVESSAFYKGADETSSYYAVNLKNTSDTVALQVRVKATDPETGDLILPAYYEDNYVNLLPGESKSITVEFEKLYFDGVPEFSVSGYNVNDSYLNILSFTDDEGDIISALSSEALVTTMTYLNRTGEAGTLSMIVAVYAPDGRLQYWGVDEREIEAGETGNFTVTLRMPENADGHFAAGGYYAYVFLWDGRYMPLARRVDFNEWS